MTKNYASLEQLRVRSLYRCTQKASAGRVCPSDFPQQPSRAPANSNKRFYTLSSRKNSKPYEIRSSLVWSWDYCLFESIRKFRFEIDFMAEEIQTDPRTSRFKTYYLLHYSYAYDTTVSSIKNFFYNIIWYRIRYYWGIRLGFGQILMCCSNCGSFIVYTHFLQT